MYSSAEAGWLRACSCDVCRRCMNAFPPPSATTAREVASGDHRQSTALDLADFKHLCSTPAVIVIIVIVNYTCVSRWEATSTRRRRRRRRLGQDVISYCVIRTIYRTWRTILYHVCHVPLLTNYTSYDFSHLALRPRMLLTHVILRKCLIVIHAYCVIQFPV